MEETVELVIAELKSLGVIVADGAEFVFGVYIKQAIIDGIFSVLFSGFAVVIFIIALKLIFKYIEKSKYFSEQASDSKHDHELYNRYDGQAFKNGAIAVLCGLIMLISVLMFFSNIQGAKCLANPEYCAIQDIVEDVQNNR